MDQEIWFLALPVLWAGFLCGLTLAVGTGILSRLLVTILFLASWACHSFVIYVFFVFTGAGIFTPGSIAVRTATFVLFGGLVLVWSAHIGVMVTLWVREAYRAKIHWAVVLPGGWLIAGLGYALVSLSHALYA